MTSREILQASLLDIVFDNRNKEYGAYDLRKDYHKRLTLAMGTGISTVLLILLLFTGGRGEESSRRPVDNNEFHLTRVEDKQVIPPPEPVKPKPAASVPAATEKLVTKIDIVQRTDQVLPADFDLLHKAIGNVSMEGPLVPGIQPPPVPVNSREGNGIPLAEPKKETKEEVMQRAAQFPGGMEAWLNYLNRNLRTPSDLEPGEKKTVVIEFQVAVDGSVTGFKVVRSGGHYFDNEVIRVLKKMPKWVPAIQNGQIVPVSFTQPVTFVGLEE